MLDRLVINRCFAIEPDMYDAIGKIESSLEQDSVSLRVHIVLAS